MANRSGASATQCYRNGASLGSGTTAATTIPGGLGNLFVCAMNPHEANPSIRQQALAFFGGSLPADEVATLCRPCASSRTCGPIALKRMMAAMIELFCDSFEEAPRDTCIVLDIEIRKIARTEANSWRCSTPTATVAASSSP